MSASQTMIDIPTVTSGRFFNFATDGKGPLFLLADVCG